MGAGGLKRGSAIFQLHSVAQPRNAPDKANIVLRAGGKDLIVGGKISLRSAAPTFGEKIIEQVGVAADNPEPPSGARGPAKDKVHIQQACEA